MEICFESRKRSIYTEVCCQVKRIQENAESVVPDISDDIGRIVSVRSSVCLKSKDISGKGVQISGEVTAALMYVTEAADAVSCLNISRQFTMEYEVQDIDAETAAHISLTVAGTQARILNPRKVLLTFDLLGELCCYKKCELETEVIPPAKATGCLHSKTVTKELNLVTAVAEKTFALSEQYTFPSGKPVPSRLISQCAEFNVSDTQLIGTKLILKGSVVLCTVYLSDEVCYPLMTEFTSAFSQIIDIGIESMDNCTAMITPTSAYYDLIDAINGEKTLDVELHAVVQVVCRSNIEINYVSDAYCNAMPSSCRRKSLQFKSLSGARRGKMVCDDRIMVSEDCADILSIFTDIMQVEQHSGSLNAAVAVDIVYRTRDGVISCVRRIENMEEKLEAAEFRLLGVRLSDVYLIPDGAYIDGRLAVEATYQSSMTAETSRVEAVVLDDENVYEIDAFPGLTLVRVENEELWELAKAYHSSEETISAINDLSDGISGKLLLVPKCE